MFNNRDIYVIGRGKAGRWLHQRFAAFGLCGEHSLLSGRTLPPSLPKHNKPVVLFFAVPDFAIASTALAYKKIITNEDVWFVHLSGAYTSAVFAKEGQQGATFHPVFSVPNEQIGQSVLHPYITIEGQAEVLDWLTKLAQRIQCHPRTITADQKELYHAGCVLAGSLSGLYYAELCALFESVGFNHADSSQITKDLIYSSIGNIDAFGIEKGLTGPVVRQDTGTQQMNLEALQKDKPQLAKLYEVLSSLLKK